MKLKPNYLLIPLITIAVALLGGAFSSMGMNWYDMYVAKPELTPPAWVFPIAWNLIFLMTTISALIIWNKGTSRKFLWFLMSKKPTPNHWMIIWLFVVNAILNVLWSYLFFAKHLISTAFIEMLMLEVTLIALIFATYKISKIASWLLVPYALWVGFASYLTYQLVLLNT
ncbi:tryptophan-rich sensory protein [Candidatus Peregrinibacteria bacterium]|jgi:translocator protein|nr:tryptophan-rich sensory protein [Candidatus Peregrinibacteria bacterium]MBT7736380.1 tryptophan-rich sensory protein [Candidatus Peregrinibacteria bacterium]